MTQSVQNNTYTENTHPANWPKTTPVTDTPLISKEFGFTLGTQRRDRLGEYGSAHAKLMWNPDRDMTVYAGAGRYLNSDPEWNESQIMAGVKAQRTLAKRIELKAGAEGRHNLHRLPLSLVDHQNYLTAKVGAIINLSPLPRIGGSYIFKLSNDFIPDGGTNYARYDTNGRPIFVTCEIYQLDLEQTFGAVNLRAQARFEPDLNTPSSPDSGVKWQGAGLGITLQGAESESPALKPWALQADIGFHQPSPLRAQSGVTAAVQLKYTF